MSAPTKPDLRAIQDCIELLRYLSDTHPEGLDMEFVRANLNNAEEALKRTRDMLGNYQFAMNANAFSRNTFLSYRKPQDLDQVKALLADRPTG